MSRSFGFKNLAHCHADELESVFTALAELAPAVVSADNLVIDLEHNCYKGTLVVRFGSEYDSSMLIGADELREAADVINDKTSNLLLYQDEMRSEMSPDFSLTECWVIPTAYEHIQDKYFPNEAVDTEPHCVDCGSCTLIVSESEVGDTTVSADGSVSINANIADMGDIDAIDNIDAIDVIDDPETDTRQ